MVFTIVVTIKTMLYLRHYDINVAWYICPQITDEDADIFVDYQPKEVYTPKLEEYIKQIVLTLPAKGRRFKLWD